MNEYAYVYILANGFKKLYVGITAELEIRVRQHKQKKDPRCHTARYNITQLVYFERFTTVTAAIAREKQLKGWLRIRKLQLIFNQSNVARSELGLGQANQALSLASERRNIRYASLTHHDLLP
jgi:putative endonuclease